MNQNDLPLEVVLHRIGTCPVCGKGQMTQGTAGWTCDYFKTIHDKCMFTIFSKYSGYELTEEDAVALIKDGRTMKHDFVTQGGKHFVARLVLDEGKVKVVGDNRTLSVPCPNCGDKVMETLKGYACRRFFEAEDRCPLYIPKEVCGREVDEDAVLQVLEYGKSAVMDGFEAQGRTFSAYMKLADDGTCRLESAVCTCPRCGGTLYAASKGFVCSNYSKPGVNCRFVIWRNMSGHEMTIDEVITLCKHGATPVITFRSTTGTEYSGRLVVNAEGRVIRI